jgi:hypothetical protein
MATGNVIPITGAREAPKAAQSRMETLIITPAMVNTWKLPPFQRPLRINDKVRAVTEQIKKTECIEGVLTLGKLKGDNSYFVVDGQHRIEAFKLSEIAEAIADVRLMPFDSMAEMADEFVRLNSSLVKMRPDDILRGLEDSSPALKAIRKSCEFVGYDNIRRGGHGPILSMSALLRCWTGASYETPTGNAGGLSAAGLAQSIDQASVQNMIAFLATAHSAWGRDPEYFRLWGNLNLALCMWLWNKLVMDRERSGAKRHVVLSITNFKHCLMSISADSDYLAWLPGRVLGDRDRSPAYGRLKTIFSKRLASELSGVKKLLLPQPAWASK